MRESGGKKAVAGAQGWKATQTGCEAIDLGRVWWWWQGTGRMVGVGEVSLHGEECPNLALSPLRLGKNTFRWRQIENVWQHGLFALIEDLEAAE